MSIEVYRDKLNSKNPDAVYEDFWLLLKDSVVNYRANTVDPVQVQLIKYSQRLNQIQEEGLNNSSSSLEWVNKIRCLIEEYLANLVLMFNHINFGHNHDNNARHRDILLTNLKRWRKINIERDHNSCPKLYLLEVSLKHLPDQDLAGHLSYQQTTDDLAFNVSLLAAEHQSSALLSHMGTYYPGILASAVKQMYSIDLPKNIKCGRKIISLINHDENIKGNLLDD